MSIPYPAIESNVIMINNKIAVSNATLKTTNR
jgi:hypothetical protein